jgi:glycosyltransferase involved in cell wall biosynthesis
MPKVSVIIPNYNYGRFLEKRIQSVLAQTYQDFEIIYLDDVSTDDSNQVLAKFLDNKRIRTSYNQVNSGSPFKQWNKGMREAKGEYVWIAEADDYADEHLLAELVDKLDNNPNVGIAYCQSWEVDENDNILSNMEWWTADLNEQRWQQDFVNSGKDELKQYLIIKNTIPNASAILLRRSVYEKVGGADESMKVAGDWMLWVKMLLNSDVAFVAKPLNYYRKHTNNVRKKTVKNGLLIEESWRTIRYIAETIEISKDVLEQACDKTVNWWVSAILYYNQYNLLPNSTNHRIYKSLKDIDPSLHHRLFKTFVKEIKRKGRIRTRLANIFGHP